MEKLVQRVPLAEGFALENIESAPRGIKPRILLEHVINTAPFLLDRPFVASGDVSYITRLRRAASLDLQHEDLSHVEYFALCLSAHYATVATFVPTDVDNQIRHRLWHSSLPLTTLQEMVEVVGAARAWDWSIVSTRAVRSPESGEVLGGHGGEWFSVAVGAYCALRHRAPQDAAEVAVWIREEVLRELKVTDELRQTGDGIGLCKASVLLAHNLGDLNRVFEMWAVTMEDGLLTEVTELLNQSPIFSAASTLNRDFMANENHRHFALRKPKCVRRSPEFLLGLGPFFDDWGEKIAVHPELDDNDRAEIIEALIHGYQKLKTPAVGYARALAGIEQNYPGGLKDICNLIPAKFARELRSGTLRQHASVPRPRFEAQWDHLGKRHFAKA